ncbi:MAG: CDP-diacylglycerol--glycerol-3-phosphate 3-phosphatidyltransferase [Clostridia bacterium]|nr:CDP-diacylglycerol--glycerol-3-phosphate 3-phosphatidyltransferase [Clostridia bacterium]
MNLPNKLTVLRLAMVPVLMIVLLLPIDGIWPAVVGCAIFILTSLTDMLDGMIARRCNLITDFGKFLDPLADKFLVFGAMLAILCKYGDIRPIFIWVVAIIIFRELAVTSMRLIANQKAGAVVAASWLGKIKTVTQMIGIVVLLLEDVILPPEVAAKNIASYVVMVLMVLFTVWSGFDYIRGMWGYLDPQK